MRRKSTAYLGTFFILLCLLWSPLFEEPSQTISSADTMLLFPPFQEYHEEYRPENPLLSDQFTQFYPWMRYNRQQVRRERTFPLWNPHQEMGVPHWANTQNAALALNNLPTYFLSLEQGLNVRAFFTVFFAFWGMFLFLRLLFRQSLLAFIGAAAFALGGYITVWLGHPHAGVAMWLGWLFWGFFRLVKRPTCTRMIYLSIFLFLSYLGGHIETAFHNVFLLGSFAVLYLLFHNVYSFRRRVTIMKLFILAGLLSFFMGSLYFFPFLEYLLQSWTYFARSQGEYGSYSLSFTYLLHYFSPEMFGNPRQYFWLVPQLGGNYNEVNGGFFTFSLLVMVIPGLLTAGKRYRPLSLSAFGVMLLCFAFAYPVPFFHSFLNSLPLFEVGANTRLIYGVAFMGIILGVLGWKHILENLTGKWIFYVTLGVLILIFAGSGIYVVRNTLFPEYVDWGQQVFILQGIRLLIIALFLVILCRVRCSVGLKKVFLAVAVFFEVALLFQGYNPIIQHTYFYPSGETTRQGRRAGLNRIMFPGNSMPANTSTYYGLYDIRNYDAMNLKRTIETSQMYRHILGAWDDYYTVGSPFFNFLGAQFAVVPHKDIMKYDYFPAQMPQKSYEVSYNTVMTQPLVTVRENPTSVMLHLHAPGVSEEAPLLVGITPCLEEPDYLVLNRYESPREGSLKVEIPSDIELKQGKKYFLQLKVDFASEESFEISSMHYNHASPAFTEKEELPHPLWYEIRYDDNRYVLENEMEGLYWYRNTQVLPRAFLTNQIRLSDETILDDMARSSMSYDNPEVFIEQNRLSGEKAVRLEELSREDPFMKDVEITEYESNRVTIPVKAPQAGLLVLSDSWYPGWQVLVDGERKNIIRTNYNFRGVKLEPGEFVVEFKYRPWSFYGGVFLTLLCMAGGLLVLYSQKRMEKKE